MGNDCLARFGALSDLDTLVTDAGLDDDMVDDIEALGVRVVRA
jgi:DeoR family fructose operon transcriptional repressor